MMNDALNEHKSTTIYRSICLLCLNSIQNERAVTFYPFINLVSGDPDSVPSKFSRLFSGGDCIPTCEA